MAIIKNLRAILKCSEDSSLSRLLDDESTFVFTNATFFSTRKEKELKGKIEDAQKESVKYTKMLINKVQPKHIICLGKDSCIKLLLDSYSHLLNNLVKFEYGLFGKIPVYGINHTSGYFWSSEEKELIGKSLGVAFGMDAEPIDAKVFNKKVENYVEEFKEERNKKESIKLEPILRWQYIYVSLCNYCEYKLGLEIAEKKDDSTRFFIKNQGGENILILSVINQSTKSIGVRYPNRQSTGKDADSILATLQTINEKFKNGQSWIGKLDLRLKDTDSCIVETKAILTNIVRELSGID